MKAAFPLNGLVLLLLMIGIDTASKAFAKGPALESPVFLPEHRIKLQLVAPEAKSVQLRGIERVPLPLQKDDKGIWNITVGPLRQGIYGYSFLIDGEASIDPLNPKTKPGLR